MGTQGVSEPEYAQGSKGRHSERWRSEKHKNEDMAVRR